jgi:hypothetical protein
MTENEGSKWCCGTEAEYCDYNTCNPRRCVGEQNSGRRSGLYDFSQTELLELFCFGQNRTNRARVKSMTCLWEWEASLWWTLCQRGGRKGDC